MSLKVQKSREIGFPTSIQKAWREGQIECQILKGKSNTHIQPTVGLVTKIFTWKVERGELS